MSVCIVSVASAYDIVVDGIGYNITDRTNRTVMVAGWDKSYFTDGNSPQNPNVGTGSDDVSGPVNLVLPWRVYYNGLYYKVTTINEEAFSECTSLKTVTIPNMITSIGEYAFQGCTNLQTVTVQWTTPLAIDSDVFEDVDLSGVVLRVLKGYKNAYAAADVWKDFGEIREYSDNVDIVMQFEDPVVKAICVENWDTNNDGELTYREAMAVEDISGFFVGNTEITRFNELRSFRGVTELGMNAFKGCSSLQTIMLPSELTSIGKEAFVGCDALASITLQAKLTTIGEKAFYGCANIESLTLPGALVKIGDHAFDGCAKIPSVYINAKLTDIGEGAFANCTSLARISGVSTNPAYSFSGYCLSSKDGSVLYCVPAGNSTKNYSVATKVVEIAPYAFAGNQNINSVTLNNVTRIGAHAFEGCKNFYTVIFPETVTQIGTNAFKGVAQGIRAQVSWNTPLSIADGTFSTFNPVTEGINGRLFVPTGKKSAYQNATGWKWFDFIEEGTIADYAAQIIQFQDETVRDICVANFDNDHDGYITYDEAAAVTSIGTLFKGKEITTFNEFQYFTSLASIPAEAFANSTLSSIILPGSVVSIGANAFAYCNNLKTFNVPASVKTIGNGVLKSCAKLTAITVDAENTNYVSSLNSLFTKDHTKLIQFPAYNNYTNIMIPDGVTTIAPEAFLGASRLAVVSIYSSVKSIGENAFGNCTALNEVKVYWESPLAVPASTFAGVDVANAKLDVPMGTQALYEAAEVWKDFGTTVEFSDQYSNLVFADSKVEAICVSKWDTNGDGKINGVEAKAVTDLSDAFTGNTEITTFEELQYFTSLKTIGNNAFKGCTALTTITMPSSVTTIGESAFEGCENLNRPMLPVALVTIGKKAFYGCKTFNRVYLYKNVASIGEGAFGMCTSVAYFQIQAGNSYYKVANDALFSYDYSTIIAYPAAKSKTDFNPSAEIKAVYPYAFSGATKITSVSFNEITSIGDYGFEGCTGLKSIDIGPKVATVGEGAFSGCGNLQSINIPSTVTSIGQKAFNGMPAGVKCQVARNTPLSINDNTFSNAGELASGQITGILFVPKGTTSRYETANGWKFFALYKETSMEDYDATLIHFEDLLVEQLAVEAWDTDGDSHISYEEAALVGNLGTTFTGKPITTFNELQYFTALTEIGDEAFKNSTLTAITMPESVTRFGKSAFQGTALSTFNRLPALTEIGDSAFAYNTGLTGASISSNITKVGTGAFKGCKKLTYFKVDEANANYKAIDGVLFNKDGDTMLQFPAAKEIGIEYVLDESVTTIGEDAFTMVQQLKTLVLHDGVFEIGPNAFRACEALDSVVVEWTNPLTVPTNTFSGVDVSNCALSVPKGSLNKYKKAAVWKNFRIDEYLIDSSIIDFEDANVKGICLAYWDTDGDHELTVAEAKQAYRLSDYFKGNTTITKFNELKYFTGLTGITNEAFRGCTALEEITLPKTITNIAKGAFGECSSLKSIQIPAATTTVGMGVFANCTSLTGISVAEGNTKYVVEDGVLFDINKTQLVAYPAGKQGGYTVPESVKTIKGYAFCGAAGLTSLKLPKNLNTLEEGALEYCSSLEFLSLPASVGSVANYNFKGCTALKTVKVAWSNALDVEQWAFNEYDFTGTRLYVPVLSKESYASHAVWGSFEKIIEYPNCDVNGDGLADMLDAVDIVKYIVNQPAASFDKILADFNEDEEITTSDAVILVNMIANGEAAPNINYAPHMDVEETVTLTKDINNVLSLCIDSEVPYTAFQFDLTLPELSEVELVQLSERLKGHQMVYNKIGDNTYRFVAISFVNKPFEGIDGSVINILAGNPDLDEIVAENIQFITADGATHHFDNIGFAVPTGIAQVMGDSRKAVEDGVYYNLNGMRVDHPTKGVYILNGKKVVIK